MTATGDKSICTTCGHIIIWTGAVWKSLEAYETPELCEGVLSQSHQPGPEVQR